MSGVTGAERVRSRADFLQFIEEYHKIIENFPGFVGMQPSGSYNSDPTKTTFGDIDLIVTIGNCSDKKLVKEMMVNYFLTMSPEIFVPFTSVKHSGKRTSNTGELVSVRFHSNTLGYSVQIDNIVAISTKEAYFKKEFLDMTAEKQGLILGLVKIEVMESTPTLLKLLNISLFDAQLIHSSKLNCEYEFSLSSTKLVLRLISYETNTYNTLSVTDVWSSQDWNDVKKLLNRYDLNKTFDQLLLDVTRTITNPRSGRRIIGLFNSMITVKSGEVGTAKGFNKEKALSKVILCLA